MHSWRRSRSRAGSQGRAIDWLLQVVRHRGPRTTPAGSTAMTRLAGRQSNSMRMPAWGRHDAGTGVAPERGKPASGAPDQEAGSACFGQGGQEVAGVARGLAPEDPPRAGMHDTFEVAPKAPWCPRTPRPSEGRS